MEHLSKNMLTLQDQNFKEIIAFLSATEIHGKGVTTVMTPSSLPVTHNSLLITYYYS